MPRLSKASMPNAFFHHTINLYCHFQATMNLHPRACVNEHSKDSCHLLYMACQHWPPKHITSNLSVLCSICSRFVQLSSWSMSFVSIDTLLHFLWLHQFLYCQHTYKADHLHSLSNLGPSTDPCGTPVVIDFQSKNKPSVTCHRAYCASSLPTHLGSHVL